EAVAIVHAGAVTACSAAARAQGVQRGQRVRLAQSLCPQLQLRPDDAAREERAFGPVLRVLEQQVPGIQTLRPGLAALRARGAARYYGGESEAAHTLLAVLAAAGHAGARAGVAD